MKLIFCILSGILFINCSNTVESSKHINESTITKNADMNENSFYDFKVKSIDGKLIDLSQYKGKKVLIVNTASECGYTVQLGDLQKLHEQYGSKVAVLGFPCNDFGGQEPGSETEIQNFCQKNYGVTFQLFEKVSVKGKDKSPLFAWLSEKEKNGWNNTEPSWNFCKYLLNERGELIKFYDSKTKPLSEEIIAAIQQ